MADALTIKLQGAEELKALFEEIVDDYGIKDAKGILKAAMKDSMLPVLLMAKSLAPKDTGALEASLRIESRRPTTRDKGSRYVSDSDTMISTVTTAPGNVLAKRKFHNLHAPTNQKIKQIGIPSDARANVQEFGSYKMEMHKYMRPALESRGALAASDLGDKLGDRLERYQSKYNK